MYLLFIIVPRPESNKYEIGGYDGMAEYMVGGF